MATKSTIRVVCPHCSCSTDVAVRHAGKRGKCPSCQNSIKVPALKSRASATAELATHPPRNLDDIAARVAKRIHPSYLSPEGGNTGFALACLILKIRSTERQQVFASAGIQPPHTFIQALTFYLMQLGGLLSIAVSIPILVVLISTVPATAANAISTFSITGFLTGIICLKATAKRNFMIGLLGFEPQSKRVERGAGYDRYLNWNEKLSSHDRERRLRHSALMQHISAHMMFWFLIVAVSLAAGFAAR